ncbi:Transformer-2 protein homolog beta [Apodemus speciosus]|uniref:Transformer-2 protein homolog beta n=1 Tax=Apodemus speciosus TaxID=105296 RepID=A0ABQ0FLQ6_APOSI
MSDSGEQNYGERSNPVLLPEVEVLMDRGNLHGIHLQGLAPRKIQGVLDQSQGPDLNLGLDPEEVLEGIIQGHGHDLARIDDPGAGLTAEIIAGATATAILPCLLEGVMLGTGANPDPNCCLGVFGLSLYTTERDLREVFSKYGPIADVSIVYDQQSRRSRGFAFVYFENVDDAKEAKERANGMELDGRRIRVDFSITKRPHTPTPGIYMGRPTYGSSRRRDYYDRGYDRGYDDRDYYSRSYRGGGGGGGGWRAAQDRDQIYRRRSPSPYYSRGGYRSRSRSRSYSPRSLLKHEVEDSETCHRAGITFVDNIFYCLLFKK